MYGFSKGVRAAMAAIIGSKGRQVCIEGSVRTITGVRPMYGTSIQLRLDAPLPGRTSELYTVDPENAAAVRDGLCAQEE
jgi:hypothetical protein